MKLRPYQTDNKQNIYNAWDSGAANVLSVLPTGAGKTVIFSDVIREHNGPCCAIAHRQELVGQISLALARDKVRHKIIGPRKVVRLINNIHMAELGVSYYSSNAPVAVAGVDTLVKRKNDLSHWLKSVSLWVQDEAHHVLTNNKWGTAADMFPNAKGLGVTATPDRADGKGLGRHADGLFDTMVEGPTMRELIDAGYLTDYRIFAPPSDYVRPGADSIGSDGDIKRADAARSVRNSHVVGDVVKHYLRIAPGKLGITFVPSVEIAIDTAAEFNRRGVPAAVVSAKTPDAERVAILRKFKNRELLQLVNVDLFGEGFDLPAIEVVSMARPTESYSLYAQQFGRALRLMISKILSGAWDTYTPEQRRNFIAQSSKPHAIIIDHVGNTTNPRFGLPDARRIWTLDRREKRSRETPTDVIPTRDCLNPECMAVYERIYNTCPFCGHKPKPSARSGPEFVDGDLAELDPATLAAMRGDIERVDMDPALFRAECVAKYMPEIGIRAHVKRHVGRQEIQSALRMSIAWWAGYQRKMNRSDSESYRRFYFAFGIDVMSAQALNSKEALDLANRVNNHLGELANG